MTIAGAIRGNGDALTVQYQYRLKDSKSDAAWYDAGTVTPRADGWTAFSFDVPKAETAPTGFRIRLLVRAAGGAARPKPFTIDDLAVVNWEPADSADRAPPGFRHYIRLPAGSGRQITLTLADWAQAPQMP